MDTGPIMKKIVLAIVAATACYSANAATVYDKDGTTFAVGGRVQAVVYNGKSSKVGDKDNSLRNTARLNVSGNTKVFDWLSVYAFSEWNMAHPNQFVLTEYSEGKVLNLMAYNYAFMRSCAFPKIQFV